MPKYLFKASYTPEGAAGILKEGGTTRKEIVAQLVQSMGGTLEAFYFAFGEADAYVIVDLPDAATVAALSLTVSGSGSVHLSTTVLLTPEELDQAAGKSVDYRPPGT